MESEDPLSELADIHLPDPVGIWPLAPGWWILGAVALILLLYGLYRLWLLTIRKRRREAALRELDAAFRHYRNPPAGVDHNRHSLDFLSAVNSILKRVALATDARNRRRIPELSGTAWLNYLDESVAATPFTQGHGQVLAEGPYQPEFRGDPEALYELARHWIVQRYHALHQRRNDKKTGRQQSPPAVSEVNS